MSDYDWTDDALCPQVDVDAVIWFPGRGGNGTEAKRICALCDVRTPCLAYAFDLADDYGGHYGVFAGTSAAQRERLPDPRGPQPAREPREVAVVRRLAATGVPDSDIGREIGKGPKAVGKLRQRHDIPAGKTAARGGAR